MIPNARKRIARFAANRWAVRKMKEGYSTCVSQKERGEARQGGGHVLAPYRQTAVRGSVLLLRTCQPQVGKRLTDRNTSGGSRNKDSLLNPLANLVDMGRKFMWSAMILNHDDVLVRNTIGCQV